MNTLICPAILFILLFVPAQVSAIYLYGQYDATSTTSGCSPTSYYLAMTSPDIDNVRLVGFRHRGFVPSYIRIGLYDDTGTLFFDSGQQNHTGNPPTWQSFPINPPIDMAKNISFGYAAKFEKVNAGDPCGFFTYYSAGGWPAGGWKGDCDQAHKLTAEPTDTTIPFSPAVGAMIIDDYTIFYALEYVLYPTIDTAIPATLNDGQTDILIQGKGFEAKDEFGAGTSKLWMTENNDWASPGIKVQQTDINWSNEAIQFNASYGGLTPGSTAYLWVENSDGQVNDTGYPVTLNIACPTPPQEVPASLSVSPDDDSYIPDTFTITADFTDPEDTVYVCLYTIDGGTNWIPATLSGTGPYTCTASNITSTDGSLLSIEMKATSCGGTSTPLSTLNRTVDAAGPVQDSFTATPGDTQCLLDWSATDTGSGLHASEPYEIRWRPYNFTSCSFGLQLYIGTDTSYNQTGLDNGSTYYYKLCLKDNFGNTSENALTCTLDATPWNVLNDGIPPGNSFANGSTLNTSASTFTLEVTNGGGTDTDTITNIVVTGTNTANISSVKIYEDDGTVANEYDAGDTLIATSTFSGDTAVFNGLNILVEETPTQYIITYDIVASPTEGETLTAYVSSATGQTYSVENNDDVDTTITIDTTSPVTSKNVSGTSWSGDDVTITFTPSDGTGSGVDFGTGIFGCFGTGCTPVVLGDRIMPTNCGAGNTCVIPFSYYSVDRAGNTESVNTDGLVHIDRESPITGSFNAIGGATPIKLIWESYTDSGSGIDYYRISRNNGATPPADCLSGTPRYLGTGPSFDDYGVTSGQQYSYRLCAYDNVGNINTVSFATATAGDPCSTGIMCDSCHGPNWNIMGGSKINPPMGHALHGPMCGECHREGADPSHVDGIVTIAIESGYQGGDAMWPFGAGPMTCGGTWSPVGGDPGGGMMGCHTMGTPTHPGLTPEWECMWDEFPMCNPPMGP